MKVIVSGFARALNRLATQTLGDDYLFEVNAEDIPLFLSLVQNALRGDLIVSRPGETHDFFHGTDVTISVQEGPSGQEDVVLFSSHRESLKYFVTHQ